jgi:hypothetical protein
MYAIILLLLIFIDESCEFYTMMIMIMMSCRAQKVGDTFRNSVEVVL